MHDFCFTPIYAAVLALGGMMGFVLKGSQESLAGGVGSACLLALFTYVSYQYYLKRQKCIPAVILSLAVSLALAYVMGVKFIKKPQIHTGIVAAASGVMSAYYCWNLILFKPHFKSTKKN